MEKTINWPLARELYVTDPTATHASVAEQVGCSLQTAKNRAAKEGWTQARELYQYEVSTKTREVAAIDLSEVRARHVKAGRALMAIGTKALHLHAEDLADMSPKEALAFVTAGIELERKALGMETLDIGIDLGRVDVKKLSDDELEELIARIDRATGKAEQHGFGKN